MHNKITIQETKFIANFLHRDLFGRRQHSSWQQPLKRKSKQTCNSLSFYRLHLCEICKHIAKVYDQLYESLHLYEGTENTQVQSEWLDWNRYISMGHPELVLLPWFKEFSQVKRKTKGFCRARTMYASMTVLVACMQCNHWWQSNQGLNVVVLSYVRQLGSEPEQCFLSTVIFSTAAISLDGLPGAIDGFVNTFSLGKIVFVLNWS